MEIVAYVVTHQDGTTCVFNPSLRERSFVEQYAAEKHGTVRDAVYLDDALCAIEDASGKYEKAVAV